MLWMYDNRVPKPHLTKPCMISLSPEAVWSCGTHNTGGFHDDFDEAVEEMVRHVILATIRVTIACVRRDLDEDLILLDDN